MNSRLTVVLHSYQHIRYYVMTAFPVPRISLVGLESLTVYQFCLRSTIALQISPVAFPEHHSKSRPCDKKPTTFWPRMATRAARAGGAAGAAAGGGAGRN